MNKVIEKLKQIGVIPLAVLRMKSRQFLLPMH